MQDNIEATVAPTDAQEVEINEATEETSSQEQDQATADPKNDEVVFPKKAVNAISRRDRTIGKLKAELAAYQAEVERFRSSQAQPQQKATDGRPDIDQFDDYGSYLEALNDWKIEQKLSEVDKKRQTQEVTQKQAQYLETREVEIAEKAQQHAKTIPDFLEVVEEHSDLLDMMPPEVQMAFYDADDASLAFYNLAKSGKLESLLTMSPYRAAMEIAKAQSEQVTQRKAVSSAPRPMTGVKGTGANQGSLESKSADELYKWLKS
jgi:hypothetical protein